MDAKLLPIGVKLTCNRMLNVLVTLLWNHQEHSNLHGPIKRSDNIELDLRSSAGCVSRSRPLAHP
jgi:hypothetical protein